MIISLWCKIYEKMKQTKCTFVIREVQKYSHHHHPHHHYYTRLEKVLLVGASTVAFIMFYVYGQNPITDGKGTEPSACVTELCSYMYCKVIWEGDAHVTRVLGMGMPISLSHRSAIGQFFSLSPVTDPEVFAKVQFSSVGPVKWRNCMKFGTRWTFRHREVTYGDHSPCPCWTALDIAAPRHFEAR